MHIRSVKVNFGWTFIYIAFGKIQRKTFFKYKENNVLYQVIHEEKESFLHHGTSADRAVQKCKRYYERQRQITVEN